MLEQELGPQARLRRPCPLTLACAGPPSPLPTATTRCRPLPLAHHPLRPRRRPRPRRSRRTRHRPSPPSAPRQLPSSPMATASTVASCRVPCAVVSVRALHAPWDPTGPHPDGLRRAAGGAAACRLAGRARVVHAPHRQRQPRLAAEGTPLPPLGARAHSLLSHAQGRTACSTATGRRAAERPDGRREGRRDGRRRGERRDELRAGEALAVAAAVQRHCGGSCDGASGPSGRGVLRQATLAVVSDLEAADRGRQWGPNFRVFLARCASPCARGDYTIATRARR